MAKMHKMFKSFLAYISFKFIYKVCLIIINNNSAEEKYTDKKCKLILYSPYPCTYVPFYNVFHPKIPSLHVNSHQFWVETQNIK